MHAPFSASPALGSQCAYRTPCPEQSQIRMRSRCRRTAATDAAQAAIPAGRATQGPSHVALKSGGRQMAMAAPTATSAPAVVSAATQAESKDRVAALTTAGALV